MIDYNKISESVNYYESIGYTRIESPWLVSREVSDSTRPSHKDPNDDYIVNHNNKALVASGEQSLLYLNLKKFLPPGKYQTVTPCFRNESFDSLHSKYFVKNELMITDGLFTRNGVLLMIEDAKKFLDTYIQKKDLIIKQTSDLSYDINCKVNINGNVEEIELGSYGIRSYGHLTWIYGTGLAEPRLSRTLKMYINGLS